MNLHTRIGIGVYKSWNRRVRKAEKGRGDIGERRQSSPNVSSTKNRYIARQIQHASPDAPCIRIQSAIPQEVTKLGHQIFA